MARVTRGRLWLDPRTVDPVDDFRLVEAVIGAYEAAQAAPGKPAT